MIVSLPQDRRFDAITFGRANMDLYTEAEKSIEETPTFTKSLGGSPANIAVAMARLGMKTGMITAVADDPIGAYVTSFLANFGVDTSAIVRDASGTSTSLAVAETRGTGSRTVLYRNNAADMALRPQDIQKTYIADARMLVISGQALSRSPAREAAMTALTYARAAGTLVVLDIDYRPYSWIDEETAAVVLSQAAEASDVVIGTREEFDALEYLRNSEIATSKKSSDTFVTDHATAEHLFSHGMAQLVVVKRGEAGSFGWTRDGECIRGPAYPVKPLKPYGAGDAFAGALLFGINRGHSWSDCFSIAAAAASINISRTRCAEDMATWEEIADFLQERNSALSH